MEWIRLSGTPTRAKSTPRACTSTWREPWYTEEHARELNFETPDPKWLKPLTLEELFEKYRVFKTKHQAVSDFPPPPLTAVAPLLAPQGWLSLTLRHDPARSRVPVFHVPMTRQPPRIPDPDMARWQFQHAPHAPEGSPNQSRRRTSRKRRFARRCRRFVFVGC